MTQSSRVIELEKRPRLNQDVELFEKDVGFSKKETSGCVWNSEEILGSPVNKKLINKSEKNSSYKVFSSSRTQLH